MKRIYSIDGGCGTIPDFPEPKPEIEDKPIPEFPYQCECGEILNNKKELFNHYHYPERREYYIE